MTIGRTRQQTITAINNEEIKYRLFKQQISVSIFVSNLLPCNLKNVLGSKSLGSNPSASSQTSFSWSLLPCEPMLRNCSKQIIIYVQRFKKNMSEELFRIKTRELCAKLRIKFGYKAFTPSRYDFHKSRSLQDD